MLACHVERWEGAGVFTHHERVEAVLPEHLLKTNKLNDPEQVMRRSKLARPEPQVSDRELEELAKLGDVGAAAGELRIGNDAT